MGKFSKTLAGCLAAAITLGPSQVAHADAVDITKSRICKTVSTNIPAHNEPITTLSMRKRHVEKCEKNHVPYVLHPKKEKPTEEVEIIGSRFGMSGGARYTATKGFTLSPSNNGTIKFKKWKFGVQDEPTEFLQDVADNPGPLVSTPYDGPANLLLEDDELALQSFGNLTFRQWYNLFKLMWPLFEVKEDGRDLDTEGIIAGNAQGHAEMYTAHDFKRGKKKLRYERSMGTFLRGGVVMRLATDTTFGTGVNHPHPASEYFGSTLDITVNNTFHVNFSRLQGHQIGYTIEDGWQGLGITLDTFYRARGGSDFSLSLAATAHQLANSNFAEITFSEDTERFREKGESYLLYAYRHKTVSPLLWYYAMAGREVKVADVLVQIDEGTEQINLAVSGEVNETSRPPGVDERFEVDANLNRYAGAFGFGDTNFHFMLGATNYPYDKRVGAIQMTFPHVVMHGWLFNDQFEGTLQGAEAYIRLDDSDTGNEVLLEYNKERMLHLVTPLPTPKAIAETARVRAYHKLQGNYLIGTVDSFDSSLTLHRSNGKMFGQAGLEMDNKSYSIGGFVRMGYGGVGIETGLARKKDPFGNQQGWSGSLALAGEFDDYWISFFAKNIWDEKPDGYLHTGASIYNPADRYFMITFGGNLDKM